MQTIIKKRLGFYNDDGLPVISAKQYDTSRIIKFKIFDTDRHPFDLNGVSVLLRVLKADGQQMENDECCSIDVVNSIVTVDTEFEVIPSDGEPYLLGEQLLAAPGTNLCEFEFKYNDEDDIEQVLTTWNFVINVEPRVHDGSEILSLSSSSELDRYLKTARDTIKSYDEIIAYIDAYERTVTQSVVAFNTFEDFPTIGVVDHIYIDKSTNITYRWDTVDNEYISLSAPVDDEMSDESTNAIQNKVVKEYIDTAIDNIEIDDEMSDTSTNAVKNKVIKKYVDDKTFTGTMEEVEIAISLGLIKEGTIVNITDDEYDTDEMHKSTYDINDNGIVDNAETLNGLDSTISELNYVHGVTSNIQSQFDDIQDTIGDVASLIHTLRGAE